MKLLLDTQAFLWWMADDPHLSVRARGAIADASNSVYVSIASAWEIAIKRALGKLDAPSEVRQALESEGFSLLQISLDHVDAVEHLPRHHRDPFDRLLVAQARVEQAALVSCDEAIGRYDVSVWW